MDNYRSNTDLLKSIKFSYRIAVLIWRCLLGRATGYLCELCRPVSWSTWTSSPSFLCYWPAIGASCFYTATRQRRAFSIVGPSTWNGLPLEIRFLPKNNESVLCRLLKTDLYRGGGAGGASE